MKTRRAKSPARVCALFGALLIAALPASQAADGLSGRPVTVEATAVVENKSSLDQISDSIRIASYNIENFQDGIDDGDRSRTQARDQARMAARMIEQINPDLIVLEEIENEAVLEMLNSSFKHSYPLTYLCRFGDEPQFKHHLALMSRLPLKKLEVIDFTPLQGSSRPPRGLVKATLDLGDNHRLLIYGVHLKSNWGDKERNIAKRRTAIKLLRRDAEQSIASEPNRNWEVLVIGDMNIDPAMKSFAGDDSLAAIADWIDLWGGHPISERVTVPTRRGKPDMEFPPTTFDRVIVNRQLLLSPWKVSRPARLAQGVNPDIEMKPGQGGHVSDHYPVYIDIAK